MLIYGKIKDGKVVVQKFYEPDLARLEGRQVEIKDYRDSKTLQQLRYLWGVVYKIVSDDTGFTQDEVSEIYKKKYLSYHKEHNGKIYTLHKGLSELTIKEMAEYIDKVVMHAQSDLGLIIPEPQMIDGET
jgi:predicted house-cleaning noncanonical NTP pyrophosphatase (MazG superfamily)